MKPMINIKTNHYRMFYKLKHYDGLLNLDAFIRIERDEEEAYPIKRVPSSGTTKNVSEVRRNYLIRFYVPEIYGGLSTKITYDDKDKRDEDFAIIEEVLLRRG